MLYDQKTGEVTAGVQKHGWYKNQVFINLHPKVKVSTKMCSNYFIERENKSARGRGGEEDISVTIYVTIYCAVD